MTEIQRSETPLQLFEDNPFLRDVDIVPASANTFDDAWMSITQIARSYLSPYNLSEGRVIKTLRQPGNKFYFMVEVKELTNSEVYSRCAIKVISYFTLILPILALLIAATDYFFQPKSIFVATGATSADLLNAAQDPKQIEAFRALMKFDPKLIETRDEENRDLLSLACKAGNSAAIIEICTTNEEFVLRRCYTFETIRKAVIQSMIDTHRDRLMTLLNGHPEFLLLIPTEARTTDHRLQNRPAFHNIILGNQTLLITDILSIQLRHSVFIEKFNEWNPGCFFELLEEVTDREPTTPQQQQLHTFFMNIHETLFGAPSDDQLKHDVFIQNREIVRGLVAKHSLDASKLLDLEGCKFIYRKLVLKYHPDRNNNVQPPEWSSLLGWYKAIEENSELLDLQ